MRRKILLVGILITLNLSSFSQAPPIEWEKCFGGNLVDIPRAIQQTGDDGYVMIGTTDSQHDDVVGNHGLNDIWVVKIDSAGNLMWQKCFGGSQYDWGYSIQLTSDGGYVIAGSTSSQDGDVSGRHDSACCDCWIAKLSYSGDLQWQKCLGGDKWDVALSIAQTSDGGYITGGWTQSDNGDVSGNHNPTGDFQDCWVVKLNSLGNIEWQKCFGGSYSDVVACIEQTKDGGYVFCASTESDDGDVTGKYGIFPNDDSWIVKLNSEGTIQWQQCLGGSKDEVPLGILETDEGSFVVAGGSNSIDEDVVGNHSIPYDFDSWIVELDSSGLLQWQKCLGGSYNDAAYSIQSSEKGGFILTGYTSSNDDDVSGNNSTYNRTDYWVVKTDDAANIQWQECMGGSNYDYSYSVQETKDGGYIVLGEAQSNDSNVSGNHDSLGVWGDFWVVKLAAPSGIDDGSRNPYLTIFPNPSTGIFQIQNSSSPIQTAEAFNLLGEKVFSTSNLQAVTSNKIDLSSQPDGVYFIHLKTAEGMVMKKVVISK